MLRLSEVDAGGVAAGERQVRSLRRRHAVAAICALLLALVAAMLLAQKAEMPSEPSSTTPVGAHG